MILVKDGIRQQCQLSLRHIGRVVRAIDHGTQLRDVVQGKICLLFQLRKFNMSHTYQLFKKSRYVMRIQYAYIIILMEI